MGQRRTSARRLLQVSALTAVAVATTFAAIPASAGAGEGSIKQAGGPTAVAGSYIVVLKDTSAVRSQGVPSTARSMVARHRGKLQYTYQKALRGFSAAMGETEAKRLAANPSVAYVQQNHRFQISGTQTNPPSWGLDRIDQRNLPLDSSYTYPNTAANVNAYIIDTGVLVSHQDFGGRAKHGRDTIDNDNDATDCHGHGTHVAGTVGGAQYGVAKAVTLTAVRVLNCEGSGTTAQVVAGIDWVTQNAVKPAVANMSLGGGVDATLDQAVKNSIASGITYAIAAGNGNFLGQPQDACDFSPARVPEAVTVGATQRDDNRASFSNFGTCLDIFAPGVDITSAWIGGNTATKTISGTSMATPHVAGGAALVLSANPGFTPAQVRDTLVNNATSGVVINPGTGSPNKLLFVGSSGTTPPPPSKYFENGTNVAIPDAGSAVTSSISVTGLTGNAPSTLKVGVDIKHSFRGDLVIDLVAPDGTAYRLKSSSYWDSADNVITTYTVNASTEVANGTWKLRVRDVYSYDKGYIDKWSLQF